MHPLDNVIWQALTTRHAQFAESFDDARRFVREVGPLGAFREPGPQGYSSLWLDWSGRRARLGCFWMNRTKRDPAGASWRALPCSR